MGLGPVWGLSIFLPAEVWVFCMQFLSQSVMLGDALVITCGAFHFFILHFKAVRHADTQQYTRKQ